MKPAVVFALFLTCCVGLSLAQAEDPKTRGKAGDALTPLAMGNSWVYESQDDDLVTTDRIEGVVLFDGQPWYLLRTYEREKDQPATEEEWVEMDLWLALIDGHECDAFIETSDDEDGFATLELGPINKFYRYPATSGETYKPNPDDQTIVMTVVSISEKIKTKAGEFDCVVYKETSTEDQDYVFTSWVAPGVGIVKTVTVDVDGTYTSELTSYTIAD